MIGIGMSMMINPYRFAAAAGGDANFSDVVFLTGFEGADASLTVTDESSFAHGNATRLSSAAISTAQFKFGTSSGAWVGGTGGFVWPTSTDYNLTDQPYTMEIWVRPNTLTGARSLIVKAGGIGSYSYWLRQNGADFQFYTSTNGTGLNLDISVPHGLTVDTWHHIALSFNGTKTRLRRDGVMIGSSTTVRNLFSSTTGVSIGCTASVSNTYSGYLDEARITKGVDRYDTDSDIAVPTAAFPRS